MPLEPNLRRRLTNVAKSRGAATAEISPAGGSVEAALGFMFRPGDRVIDRVTGLEGVVDAGHPVASLVRAANPTIG